MTVAWRGTICVQSLGSHQSRYNATCVNRLFWEHQRLKAAARGCTERGEAVGRIIGSKEGRSCGIADRNQVKERP